MNTFGKFAKALSLYVMMAVLCGLAWGFVSKIYFDRPCSGMDCALSGHSQWMMTTGLAALVGGALVTMMVWTSPAQKPDSSAARFNRMSIAFIVLGGIAVLGGIYPSLADIGKPQMVGGLSGVVYNYDQKTYVFVKLNGKTIGSVDDAPLGKYTGGGSSDCCLSLPANAREVEIVLVEPGMRETKILAPIEKWWPDAAHSLVVHILPQKKVVVEITARSILNARADLLRNRIQELGLSGQVSYEDNRFWKDGPDVRADGQK